MGALAIALTLRQAGLPYQVVGATTGAYALLSAVGGPLLGRLVDRAGQPRVLAGSAVIAAAGFLLVAVAPDAPAVALTGAALAGAATPPLEPCLRALWPSVVDRDRLERAYALDSGTQELIFVAGPLLVAACVAVSGPAAALWLAAALGALGVGIVATAPPSRRWAADHAPAHWLGALRSRQLTLLLVGLAGPGVAVGSLNVLVVAYAERQPVVAGPGGLLALHALGAMLGAFIYGAIRWPLPAGPRTPLLAVCLALGYWPLCLVPGPLTMSALLLLTGSFLAPLLAASFARVGELAPRGTTTEAFAWLVTLFVAGNGLGGAVGGALLASGSLPLAGAAGAAGASLGALVLLGALRRPAPD
jgi:predicted MFS family arabinose efflux permease